MRYTVFRGYSEKYKSWHYGSLELAKGGKLFIKSLLDNGTVARTRVDRESVGQWTGLGDCKGNPIYEGDLVEDGEGIVYEVCWDGNFAMYELFSEEHNRCLNFDKYKGADFEVVGNYYEGELK